MLVPLLTPAFFSPFLKIIRHVGIAFLDICFQFVDRCDGNNNQLLEMKPRKRTLHASDLSLCLSNSCCFYICWFAVIDAAAVKSAAFASDTAFYPELCLHPHLLGALMAPRSPSRYLSNMSIPMLTAGNLQARLRAELIASFFKSVRKTKKNLLNEAMISRLKNKMALNCCV